MNWGHKIAIAFALFVAYILFLVYKTTQENIDLVAEDYYEQEVAYQEVIDKVKNYNALSEELTIKETATELTFSFPHPKETAITGKLYIFRPSEAKHDITFPIETQQVVISKQLLIKGLYKIKASWSVNNIEYYNEQSHFVQ